MKLIDAKLPETTWDTIISWTGGAYDYIALQDCLRKLGRPIPGHGASYSQLHSYVETDTYCQEPTTSGEPQFMRDQNPFSEP